MISVNKGVNAFIMPAIALSILVSAIQNKNAGKNVPRKPVRIISGYFDEGILLSAEKAKGTSTIAPDEILMAATWNALNRCRPAFIKINELPQMIQISKKSNQLIHEFFNDSISKKKQI